MLKVKILQEIDKSVWNRFVETSPWGSIEQMWEYGDMQKDVRPLRLAVIKDGGIPLLLAQVLLKKIPLLGTYAYVPKGPVFFKKEDLKTALPYLNYFFNQNNKNYNFICVEIEPPLGMKLDLDIDEEQKDIENEQNSYVETVLNKSEKTDFVKIQTDLDQSILEIQQKNQITKKSFKNQLINEAKEDTVWQKSKVSLDSKISKDESSFVIGGVKTLEKKRQSKSLQTIPGRESSIRLVLKSLKDKPRKKPENYQKFETRIEEIEFENPPEITNDKPPEILEVTSFPITKMEDLKKEKEFLETIKLQSENETPVDNYETAIVLISPQEIFAPTDNYKKINDYIRALKSFILGRKFQTKTILKPAIRTKTNHEKLKPVEIKELPKEIISKEILISDLDTLWDKEVLEIFENNNYLRTDRNSLPTEQFYLDLKNTDKEDFYINPELKAKFQKISKSGIEIWKYLPTDTHLNLKLKYFIQYWDWEEEKADKKLVLSDLQNLFQTFFKSKNLTLLEIRSKDDILAMSIVFRARSWVKILYEVENPRFKSVKAKDYLRWQISLMASGASILAYSQQFNKVRLNQKQNYYNEVLVESKGILALSISPIKFAIWDAYIWLKNHALKELVIWFDKVFKKKKENI
jgi:hypothetical protein